MLWISTRRRGRSLGTMLKDEVGTFGGAIGMFAIATIMIMLIAVLGLVVINALAESPWGVFSIGMTIPIAIFMGLYMRYLRPGAVAETSIIGGGWVAETDWGQDWFTPVEGRAVLVPDYLGHGCGDSAGLAAAGSS